MILRTPNDVVQAVGPLGSEYYDSVLYTDAAGFSIKRRYAAETALGQIATRGGEPAVVCLLRILVDAPTAEGGVSRVEVSAGPHPTWSNGSIGGGSGEVRKHDA